MQFGAVADIYMDKKDDIKLNVKNLLKQVWTITQTTGMY